MDIIFDFINQNLDLSSPWGALWVLIKNGGFVFVFFALFIGFRELWIDWRQNKFVSAMEWVYLAIDVPKDNESSFKSIEQIFNQLSGALKGSDFKEKYWTGYVQPNFSLELVSVEGYIQYIIRAPKIFRDLTEAAIYAQYPDAQITEIEDYTKGIDPENFKQKGYDFWGSQFGLIKSWVYPLKTYPLFEHPISKTIADPMAGVLEIFSRMRKGEQSWLQIVIKPVGDDWQEKSTEEAKKLIKAELPPAKKDMFDKALDVPHRAVSSFNDIVFGPASATESESKDSAPSMMQYLSPGEKAMVESVERKSEKVGFKCKMRYIYLSRGTKLDKPKGVSGFIGSLKQFSLLNSNGFKPLAKTKTAAEWWQKQEKNIYKKQLKILKNFKNRSQGGGVDGDGFILNTEELASLYHFPLPEVVAPAVKTTQSKRVDAPMELPIDQPEFSPFEGTSFADKVSNANYTPEEESVSQPEPQPKRTPEKPVSSSKKTLKEKKKQDKQDNTHLSPPTNLPI